MKLSPIVRSPWFHFLSVGLFFIAFFLIYFHSILFSNLFFVNDGSIQAPYKVPTWTLNLFSGYPLFSDPIYLSFYPLKTIIYNFLQLDFNFYIVSGYFLMAYFTYCYIYHLTHHKIASVFGAIIYSFSGYAIFEIGHATHFIHTICWMPLILLSFEKLKNKFSLAWGIISITAMICSILAGFPQLSLAMQPVIVGYAIMLSVQNNKKLKSIFFYLAIIICSYLITMPLLLSTIVLSLFSNRAHISWEFFAVIT